LYDIIPGHFFFTYNSTIKKMNEKLDDLH